jgi:hypothetical protein
MNKGQFPFLLHASRIFPEKDGFCSEKEVVTGNILVV